MEHENEASWWVLISFVLIQFSELPGMKPLSYQPCNKETCPAQSEDTRNGLFHEHPSVALERSVAAAATVYHEPVCLLLGFKNLKTGQ